MVALWYKLSLSYGQSYSWGSACSLQQHKVTGPVSLLYLYLALLSSPEGTEFGYEAKKSTRSTVPRICPTDTSVCAWGVKASCLHSCPGSGPSPCLLSPGARPVALSGTWWMSTGGEGGGFRRVGDCCIYLWWLCCEGYVQIWLRGNLCPPHLYPDPGSDPSLSSPLYHKWCLKALEY